MQTSPHQSADDSFIRLLKNLSEPAARSTIKAAKQIISVFPFIILNIRFR